jgi:periplasmic divalent cation tolerance protein
MQLSGLILVYITCGNLAEAKKVGQHLLEKRLAGCINIFPHMQSAYFWPPKSGKIEEAKEVVLIAKTIKSKYKALEKEIYKIHSYQNPCILAIPVELVAKKYYDWLKGELG